MMAFAIETYLTNQPLYNPRYTRWIVKFWKQLESGPNIDYYELHPCTDAELLKFYPSKESTAKKVASL